MNFSQLIIFFSFLFKLFQRFKKNILLVTNKNMLCSIKQNGTQIRKKYIYVCIYMYIHIYVFIQYIGIFIRNKFYTK